MSKFECTNSRCIYGCKLEVNGQKKAPEKCQYTGMETHWVRVESEQFGNSEQLPKLTVDVFNQPDCPEWAKWAGLAPDGCLVYFRNCPDLDNMPALESISLKNSLIERPEKKELRHTPDFLPIRFKKLHPDAKAPYQATPGSAGWDLTATSVEPIKGNLWLNKYGTGLAVEIPKGYVGLVFPRSSVYKTHTGLTNCVGVIDSDYRGEISAVFTSGAKCNDYKVGDRICQLVIMPIPAVRFVEAEELTETERGAGQSGYCIH